MGWRYGEKHSTFHFDICDEVATSDIFQLLSLTSSMPVMLLINLSSVLKRLILEITDLITVHGAKCLKPKAGLSQYSTKEIMASRFKARISSEIKKLFIGVLLLDLSGEIQTFV